MINLLFQGVGNFMQEQGMDLESQIMQDQMTRQIDLAKRDVDLQEQYAIEEQSQYKQNMGDMLARQNAMWSSAGVELGGSGSPATVMKDTRKDLMHGLDVMKQRHATQKGTLEERVKTMEMGKEQAMVLQAFNKAGAVFSGIMGMFQSVAQSAQGAVGGGFM